MAANLKYKSGTNWLSYNDVIYPVGAVYIGYTSTSPATLFGGTWTAITGRFPYFNAGTTVGGSNTHKLTMAETPRHQHGIDIKNASSEASGYGATITAGFANRLIVSVQTDAADGWKTTWYGGNSDGTWSAFSTMPAYQTLYAWRRTA